MKKIFPIFMVLGFVLFAASMSSAHLGADRFAVQVPNGTDMAGIYQNFVADGDDSEWEMIPPTFWWTHEDAFQLWEGSELIDASDLALRVILGWNEATNHVIWFEDRYDDVYVGWVADFIQETVELGIDGDHSGGRYMQMNLDDLDSNRFDAAFAQNWRYFVIRENPVWLWGAATWVNVAPYSDFGWSFDGNLGDPGNLIAEMAVTPFDDLDPAGIQTSIVHDLTAGEVIGVGINVQDVDMIGSINDPNQQGGVQQTNGGYYTSGGEQVGKFADTFLDVTLLPFDPSIWVRVDGLPPMGTISVSLPHTSIPMGGTLSAPILMEGDVTGRGIISVQMNISYDSNVIEAIDLISQGTLSQGWTIADTVATGIGTSIDTVKVAMAAPGPDTLSGSGDLVLINFVTSDLAAIGDSTALVFEDFFFNERDPVAATRNGYVQIFGPTVAGVSVSRALVPVGHPVVIFADVTNADSVEVRVWDPNDMTFAPVHLTLFDDGAHNDGLAGDRRWASDPWLTPADHPRFFYVDILARSNLGAESRIDSVASFETAIFVTLGAGEEVAGPGGQALVPIFARSLNGADVVSGEVTLRFDPNLVQFIRAFPGLGQSFPSGFVFNSAEPGRAVIAFALIAPLFDTPEGILAFAVFQVSPGALLGSRIDIFVPEDQSNVNEGLPPVTTFDGGITVELVGDISRNGQIKSFDAALALMHSVRFRDILVEFFGGDESLFLAISDVTRNGSVTAMDAVRILQFVVELIPGLPLLGSDGLAKVTDAEPRTVSMSDALEIFEGGLKVSLSIDDMSGVLGADISISYDSSRLKAVSVSPSDMLSSFMFQSNIKGDEVKIAFASIDPVESGGEIAYIEFEIIRGVSDYSEVELLRIKDVQLNEGLILAITGETELSLESSIPETYSLSQNYPNPFNPETVIHYDLPVRSHVNISVYNMMGQKVAILVDREVDAGSHSVVWDGKDYNGESPASGIYVVRMAADGFVNTRKLVLMK